MDEETYARIPETLVLREIRYQVVEPGRRTHTLDIITTLTDAKEYSQEEIAELYGFRWNSELDIRSIKSSLQDSGDDPARILGDLTGLQFDTHDGGVRGFVV